MTLTHMSVAALRFETTSVEFSKTLSGRLGVAVDKVGVDKGGNLIDLMAGTEKTVRLDAGHRPDKVHALFVEELVEWIIGRNGDGITAGMALRLWVLATLDALIGFV